MVTFHAAQCSNSKPSCSTSTRRGLQCMLCCVLLVSLFRYRFEHKMNRDHRAGLASESAEYRMQRAAFAGDNHNPQQQEMNKSENTRRRRRQPLLPPSVLAARNKEMKQRLSASSLVLGGVGRETRDWSLSSAQPGPTGLGALDPAQRANNLAMKRGV